MTEQLDDAGALAPPARPAIMAWKSFLNRLLTGKPLFLASAGFLLYGINALTTDPRFIGAESSLLRFNFCALAAYEIMLAVTAIALSRRGLWHNAMLLIALANAFVIVPFSLISRAAWLSQNLAWSMCAVAGLFAALKLWAFKRFVPGLNLPPRLLVFGAVLLLANAAAPLHFKALDDDFAAIDQWLAILCLGVLPTLAGLANILPRPIDAGPSPAQKRWIPMAFHLGWVAITACHVLGLAHSSGGPWSLSLVVPTLWVIAWTLHRRLADFTSTPVWWLPQTLASVPLLIPLLAGGVPRLLPVLAALNLGCYAALFLFGKRTREALVRLLAAAAILLSALPQSWLDEVIPQISRGEWIVCCLVLCFFWLTFLSRDPRLGLAAVVGLVVSWTLCFPDLARPAVQFSLMVFLLHSLRWEDRAHRGAQLLRHTAGVLWLGLSWSWLWDSADDDRFIVYAGASLLLAGYGARAVLHSRWQPRAIPFYAAGVLAWEPVRVTAGELGRTAPGLLAIAASFLLFGLGSWMAFTRSKQNQTKAEN